jgi:hypothetical protein
VARGVDRTVHAEARREEEERRQAEREARAAASSERRARERKRQRQVGGVCVWECCLDTTAPRRNVLRLSAWSCS